MSQTGFEFTSFHKPPIDAEFKPDPAIPDGDGVQLKLNLTLLTLERMQQIDAAIDELVSSSRNELSAAIAESEASPSPATKKGRKLLPVAAPTPEKKRTQFGIFKFEATMLDMKIRLLAGDPDNDDPYKRFVHSWNVIRDKAPVPVCYDTFAEMPQKAVNDLYDFVTGAANKPTPSEKKE